MQLRAIVEAGKAAGEVLNVVGDALAAMGDNFARAIKTMLSDGRHPDEIRQFFLLCEKSASRGYKPVFDEQGNLIGFDICLEASTTSGPCTSAVFRSIGDLAKSAEIDKDMLVLIQASGRGRGAVIIGNTVTIPVPGRGYVTYPLTGYQQGALAGAEMRLALARRALGEVEPRWSGPQQLYESVSGYIAATNATAQAAEARYLEVQYALQRAERPRYVYRVIRPEEDPALGLTARIPDGDYSLTHHVRNGSRGETQFISTTTDPAVALRYSIRSGYRIVRIDRAMTGSW